MKSKFLYLLLMTPMLVHAGTMNLDAVSWQGLYLGGNMGAAWGLLTNKLSIVNNAANPLFYSPSIPGVNDSGSNQFNPLRFTVGVQGGYNQELNPHFLAGLELGYNYINLSETFHKAYLYTNSPTIHFYSLKNNASATQMGSLRARLGYHLVEYLPYITAGGAVSNISYKQTFTDLQYDVTHETRYSKARYGWSIGAGMEYFPLKKVSFKLEYLYTNFGTVAVNNQFLGTGALSGLSATWNNSLKNIAVQTLLLGCNVHFA